MRKSLRVLAALTAAVVACHAATTLADAAEVSIAKQYGDSYLPLMVMEHDHLIEAQAEKAGLGAVKVNWRSVSGGAAANDALLSGSIDFVSGGVGPMLKLWSASHGAVKGVAALNALPLLLNVNRPEVKSIRDLTEHDKIAVPAVGVSMQAVILRMAAAQAFGEDNFRKLDNLTVTMKQADAAVALISGKTELTGHFGNSPFEFQELEHSNVHTILNSFEVLDGPATFGAIWTTEKFHNANPKLYGAVLSALREAVNIINANRKTAADLYVKLAHSKLAPDFVEKILTDPKIGYQYNLTPLNTMKYAAFMHKIGQIKMRPMSWKDYFFPEIYDLPGS